MNIQQLVRILKNKYVWMVVVLVYLVVTGQIGAIIPQTTKPIPTESPVVVADEYRVLRVVDGDTLVVMGTDGEHKVRIIGINTPETVDPRRQVECFGKEASNYAKSLLVGKAVKLTADPTQTATDKYGRWLRYVEVDGVDVGRAMIAGGYAYEYTYDSDYQRAADYRLAARTARQNSAGLWGACPPKN